MLKADVSEHCVGSIFKGRSMMMMIIIIDLPLKMETTQCFETSTFSIQTPGIHPKENLFQTLYSFPDVTVLCSLQSVSGESLMPASVITTYLLKIKYFNIRKVPQDEPLVKMC
jgi:hypothetical protein